MYSKPFRFKEHAIHLPFSPLPLLSTAKLIANFDYRRWLDGLKAGFWVRVVAEKKYFLYFENRKVFRAFASVVRFVFESLGSTLWKCSRKLVKHVPH